MYIWIIFCVLALIVYSLLYSSLEGDDSFIFKIIFTIFAGTALNFVLILICYGLQFTFIKNKCDKNEEINKYPLISINNSLFNLTKDGLQVMYDKNGTVILATYNDIKNVKDSEEAYLQETKISYKSKWLFEDINEYNYIIYVPLKYLSPPHIKVENE